MVLFHFRVHIDNLSLDKLVAFMKSNASVMIIAKEMGERPHIHSIISPIKTVSTYRQKFIQEFPMCKGNKCYSLEKVQDEEKMKAYICKGEEKKKPEIIYTNGVDVDSYYEKYWVVNKELKTNNGTVKKEKSVSWMNEVKMEFVTKYPVEVQVLSNPIECMWNPTDAEKADYKKCQKELLGHVLKKLGKSVKVLDDNILLRMYKGIHNSLIQEGNNTGKYVDFMFDKIGL